MELSIEVNGSRQVLNVFNLNGVSKDDFNLILRLVKTGDIYNAYCSTDGKKFTAVGMAQGVFFDIQAGMIVCDGVVPASYAAFARRQPASAPQETGPFEVAFDYFKITKKGNKTN